MVKSTWVLPCVRAPSSWALLCVQGRREAVPDRPRSAPATARTISSKSASLFPSVSHPRMSPPTASDASKSPAREVMSPLPISLDPQAPAALVCAVDDSVGPSEKSKPDVPTCLLLSIGRRRQLSFPRAKSPWPSPCPVPPFETADEYHCARSAI